MEWQGALRARLIAAAPVAALLPDYIPQGQTTPTKPVFWVDRPQASKLPAITLQTITEERPQTMAGFDGLDRSMVQMDVWGTSYAQVQQVKEAALAAVIGENNANGVRFSRAFIDSIRDLGEQLETQFIHRASIDLIFHHATA